MSLISIVIPAKGRPLYTRDAVFSAIRQDFDDFDVTLSNNGADPSVKAAVAEFMNDPRFHYIEQPSVLEMSSHWEVASRAATGRYLIVLTNRSVLKQGALRRLSGFVRGGHADVEVVTWGWDSYDNAGGVLTPCPFNSGNIFYLRTSDELLKFARGADIMYHVYTLPGGANSCVSRGLLERIRRRQGHAFRKIDPGLTFAFSCLLNADELVHVDEAFHVAQGADVSNGASVISGDSRPYMDSLGLAEPWSDVPVKAALVVNAIAQDFLATLREYGRDDIRAEWNRSNYYLSCLGEIRIKRKAGLLSAAEIDELNNAVMLALRNEAASVRAAIPSTTRRVFNKMKSLARMVSGSQDDVRHARGNRSPAKRAFRTTLEAAGFEH